MSFAEYLQHRLFAETEASVSMASGTGLLNQQTCEWDDELLQHLEIASARLPVIAQPGRLDQGSGSGGCARWAVHADRPGDDHSIGHALGWRVRQRRSAGG